MIYDNNLQLAAPASPPPAYFGGKVRLARLIIERLEAIPHNGYAEPFLGLGEIEILPASRL